MTVRRPRRCHSLIASLTSVVLAVAGPAAADTVQQVLEKYRLLGVFAADCSRPPDQRNIYQVIREIDANSAQIDAMSGLVTVDATFFADKAEAVGPTALRIVGTVNDVPLEVTWQVERDRQRFLDIKLKGAVITRDGTDLVGLQSHAWLQRCPPPGETPAQSAAAAAPAGMPGEPPTYEGQVDDWIGGNLLFVQSPTGGVKKVDLSLHGIVGREGSVKEAQEIRARLEAFAKGRVIRCWLKENHKSNVCYLGGKDIALWALEQKLVRPGKDAPPEYLAVSR